jgi:hypothetical protein
VAALGKMISEDNDIPEASRKAALHDAIANYINKSEPNLNGQTALHLTAHFPQLDIKNDDLGAMVFLLNYGANPNAQDNNGNTLMHHYAAKCVAEVSEYIENGNKRKEGENVFTHYMTRVCTLAYYKGDPNLTNKLGHSPVSIMKGLIPGLEEEALICYQRALNGDVPPGKVVVKVPEQIQHVGKAPQGVHTSRILAEQNAHNDNRVQPAAQHANEAQGYNVQKYANKGRCLDSCVIL